MKSAFVIITAITSLLVTGCIKSYDNFLLKKNEQKIIALQPLNYYDTIQLNAISQEISTFYDRKVIILKPVNIPSSFRLTGVYDEVFSADSLLKLLSGRLNHEIIEVIGLTHYDIYTIKKEKNNPTKSLPSDNQVHSVFGLSYLPGNLCIISDYRLSSNDTARFIHRLRTVIIHEAGHNLGLKHCETPYCVMSDQNGKLTILDKSGNDYCHTCRRELNY